MTIFKKFLRSLFTGLFLGALILGAGGRLFMRVIAEMGGLEGGFSWGGSLEVVLVGLITGGIAGICYPLWLRIPLNKNLQGILYGLLVFMVFLLAPVSGKGAARGFPDLQLQIYIGFGLLFLLFGYVLSKLVKQ